VATKKRDDRRAGTGHNDYRLSVIPSGIPPELRKLQDSRYLKADEFDDGSGTLGAVIVLPFVTDSS
jgi:hypothetical protein